MSFRAFFARSFRHLSYNNTELNANSGAVNTSSCFFFTRCFRQPLTKASGEFVNKKVGLRRTT